MSNDPSENKKTFVLLSLLSLLSMLKTVVLGSKGQHLFESYQFNASLLNK